MKNLRNTILNIVNSIFVAGFMVVIFFNYFYSNTHFLRDTSSTEKRVLNTCPTLLRAEGMEIREYIDKILQFRDKFDKCYNDQFGLRNKIVAQANLERLKNFDISPSNQVLKGSDGWFEFYDTLQKNYLDKEFDDAGIEPRYETLLARQEYFKSKGIKYYTFIAPMKINFLQKYFTEKFPSLENSGSLKLAKYNETHGNKLNLVTFHDVLSKDPEHFYYKSDFHWNEDGAYEGYKVIYNTLSADGVKMNYVDKSACTKQVFESYKGDLATLASIGDADKAGEFNDKNINHYVCYKSGDVDETTTTSENGEPRLNFKNNLDKGGTKAIFLRDSYALVMTSFLSSSFSNLDMIYSPTFFENGSFEIIQKEKPDVVIQMFVESNMIRGSFVNNEEIDSFWAKNRCKVESC